MRRFAFAALLAVAAGCASTGEAPSLGRPDGWDAAEVVVPLFETNDAPETTEEAGEAEEPVEVELPEPKSEPRFPIRPAVDVGLFLPESGRLERTYLYGGSLAYRLLSDLYLELSFLRSTFDVERRAAPDDDGDINMLAVNARYFFLAVKDFRGYGLAGAGYDWFTVDPKVPGEKRRRREGPAFNIGLGTEIQVERRAWLALELRYHRAFENVDENIWTPLLSVVIDL